MNISRAREIVVKPDMVHVTYNGEPIYIENVNPAKETASIHLLNQPHYSQEVSLTQLVE
jgi:small acid-soluble spore protein H (minor)